MERRSAVILSRGTEYFEQIVADREEETLHLEFKTLSHDGGHLKNDDKKMIGKSIGGMANAEGGVLIIGVETETSDGVDVAVRKRAIKSLERTTNLVRSYISDVLSPQHVGIEVFCEDEQGKQDEGFIVIDVPSSSNRPHFSNSHHQYFRRGSDRTRVLEHSENSRADVRGA
jgi:predicted HTH transcriptional regulator